MEPKLKWRRTDVASCNCQSLKNVHVHCPCINCEYQAVSVSTEYRHWKQFSAVADGDSDSIEGDLPYFFT